MTIAKDITRRSSRPFVCHTARCRSSGGTAPRTSSIRPPSDPLDRPSETQSSLSANYIVESTLSEAQTLAPDVFLADEAVSTLSVSRCVKLGLDARISESVQQPPLSVHSTWFINERHFAMRANRRSDVMCLSKLVETGLVEQIFETPSILIHRHFGGDTGPPNKSVKRSLLGTRDFPSHDRSPSGYQFYTQCPETREVCTRRSPDRFRPFGGLRPDV